MRPDLLAERRACHAGIRARIQLVAHERGLSQDEIKPAMSLKHYPLIRFVQEHRLSPQWLFLGKLSGLLRQVRQCASSDTDKAVPARRFTLAGPVFVRIPDVFTFEQTR